MAYPVIFLNALSAGTGYYYLQLFNQRLAFTARCVAKKINSKRPGAFPLRRKEPAPGLVTVKELVTEPLQSSVEQGFL